MLEHTIRVTRSSRIPLCRPSLHQTLSHSSKKPAEDWKKPPNPLNKGTDSAIFNINIYLEDWVHTMIYKDKNCLRVYADGHPVRIFFFFFGVAVTMPILLYFSRWTIVVFNYPTCLNQPGVELENQKYSVLYWFIPSRLSIGLGRNTDQNTSRFWLRLCDVQLNEGNINTFLQSHLGSKSEKYQFSEKFRFGVIWSSVLYSHLMHDSIC